MTGKRISGNLLRAGGWILFCILLSGCALTDLFVQSAAPATRPPESTPAAVASPAPSTLAAPSNQGTDEQVSFAQQFDSSRALEHVRALTSRDMAGRKAGAPGADRAADFIAEKFRAAGLLPAGDNNTYFQSLTLPFIDLGEAPVLSVVGADGSVRRMFEFRSDFRESGQWLSSDGHAEGQVVFLGRGGARDLELAGDLRNKIALIFQPTNTPVTRLMESLSARGVAGLIVITSNPENVKFKSSYIVGSQRTGETRPLLVVTSSVAEELLQGSGSALSDLEARVRADAGAFASTPNRVRMSMRLAPAREAATKNVLGVLPGSDPALAGEVVIVGGHYDHVGADPGGVLFAGANDNASGTAVVVALAEQFGRNGVRPKRTILFAAWTAEESGLVGSKHYVEHPAFPLTKTVGYINLDVVGAGEGLGLTVTNDSPSLAEVARASARELGVRTGGGAAGGGSDHESFLTKGVRSVFLIWQNIGPIHTPDDTFDQIDVNKLRATGQVTALVLLRLANQ